MARDSVSRSQSQLSLIGNVSRATPTRRFLPQLRPGIALACLAIAVPHCGRIFYPTTRSWTVPKAKVAITLDAELLDRVDELVARREFRNRSQAIETALAEKLARARRTRLARECAKLDPEDEKALAEEGLAGS